MAVKMLDDVLKGCGTTRAHTRNAPLGFRGPPSNHARGMEFETQVGPYYNPTPQEDMVRHILGYAFTHRC